MLVSNQHYSSLVDLQKAKNIFMEDPVHIRITDFGEARGRTKKFQTNDRALASKTRRMDRGTLNYMAPELFEGKFIASD